jgi:hypothetical protein
MQELPRVKEAVLAMADQNAGLTGELRGAAARLADAATKAATENESRMPGAYLSGRPNGRANGHLTGQPSTIEPREWSTGTTSSGLSSNGNGVAPV